MNTPGLNPNLVLAAIVVTVVGSLGTMAAVFLAGGSADTIAGRVGLVTAFVVPTITALVALLVSGMQRQQVTQVAADLQTHREELAGTEERVTAIEQALPPDAPALPPAAQK